MTPLAAAEFAALMDGLEPFEPAPRVAVAVSGGADSVALAMLAHGWAQGRGGSAVGFIVDHGLRAESGAEAASAGVTLGRLGIAARVLPVSGLARGPGLAARARAARYAALSAACAKAGILHLLLGHHAGDQAETLDMRRLAGSGAFGLACMPALAETASVRLLRPLLTVAPGRLRATLRARGVGWTEDPSNRDPATLRTRLRAARNDPAGDGAATRAACAEAADNGRARAVTGQEIAAVLARRARMFASGFALLTPGPLPGPVLAALLRTIGGAAWAPSPARVAALAAAPRAATLGGVRMLPAGRLLHGGWLLVREAAATAPPVTARHGAMWDGRFRLGVAGTPPDGALLGALADDAAAFRAASDLPACVLATLPAIRVGGEVLAIPSIAYRKALLGARFRAVFAPAVAASAAAFRPARAS